MGEILRKARLEKNLDFETIEKRTKIRKKFMLAMEANDWDKLPSETYIKGFLRNYSNFLGLKPDGIVAIFRRQYPQDIKAKVLPEGLSEPLNTPILKITPQRFTIVITGFLVILFSLYLVLQYISFTSPPPLDVISPKEGEIFSTSEIRVAGKTNSDASVFINNQKVGINRKGEFEQVLSFDPGVNTIIIESENRIGKRSRVNRTIQIETLPQNQSR